MGREAGIVKDFQSTPEENQTELAPLHQPAHTNVCIQSMKKNKEAIHLFIHKMFL